jgi:hypothetical protein
VARSRNHCFSGNATMHSVCIVEIHITVNNMKIFSVAQTCSLGDLILPAATKHLYVFVCSSDVFVRF